MRLADKVALVTGGGSGIGRATAERVAAEGARLVVAVINLDGARETVARIVAGGGEALAVEADVTQAGMLSLTQRPASPTLSARSNARALVLILPRP